MGLSRGELARSFGTTERTVQRWEDDGKTPSGLASEIFNAIENALAQGASGQEIGRRLRLGVGALIYYGLVGSTSAAS